MLTFIARSLIALLIALTFIGIAIPSSPVHAQAVTLSGTIDASSECMVDGGSYAPYDSITFTVPTTASYTISFVSKTITGGIPILLYAGSYDPSLDWFQPSYVALAFSGGPAMTETLTAGTTYILVVNNWQYFGSLASCEGRTTTDSGTYTLSSSGPIIFPGRTGSSEVVEAEPVPGCDVLISIPEQAVVGTFIDYATAYWRPGETTYPPVTIDAGKSYWVAGLDDSGQYYKVLISCVWVWVEVGTVGPNYDDVWNGTPLPIDVVE